MLVGYGGGLERCHCHADVISPNSLFYFVLHPIHQESSRHLHWRFLLSSHSDKCSGLYNYSGSMHQIASGTQVLNSFSITGFMAQNNIPLRIYLCYFSLTIPLRTDFCKQILQLKKTKKQANNQLKNGRTLSASYHFQLEKKAILLCFECINQLLLVPRKLHFFVITPKAGAYKTPARKPLERF